MVKGKQSIQVSIVSDFSEELRSQILYRLDAGVTLVCGEKGVGKSNTKMIVTIIPHRKFPELKQLIQKVDPNAFVVSCEVGEVSGRGFTYEVRPS